LVGNHARYSTPSSSNIMSRNRGTGSGTGSGTVSGKFDRSAAESVDLSELGEGIASASVPLSSSQGSSNSISQSAELESRQSTEKLEYAGTFVDVRGPQKSNASKHGHNSAFSPPPISSNTVTVGQRGGAIRSKHTKGASDLVVEETDPSPSSSSVNTRVGNISSSSSGSSGAAAGTLKSPTATNGGTMAASSSSSSVTSPEAQLDKLLQLELSYARALAMNARPPPPLSPELPHSFADDDDDDDDDNHDHNRRSNNSGSSGGSGADLSQQGQRTSRDSGDGPVLPRFQAISSPHGTGSSSSSSSESGNSKIRRSLISAYVDSRRLSSSSAAAIAARLGHSASKAPGAGANASAEATSRANKDGWSEPPRPALTVMPRSPLKPPPPL